MKQETSSPSRIEWALHTCRLRVLFNWVVNLTGLLMLVCFSFLYFTATPRFFIILLSLTISKYINIVP